MLLIQLKTTNLQTIELNIDQDLAYAYSFESS